MQEYAYVLCCILRYRPATVKSYRRPSARGAKSYRHRRPDYRAIGSRAGGTLRLKPPLRDAGQGERHGDGEQPEDHRSEHQWALGKMDGEKGTPPQGGHLATDGQQPGRLRRGRFERRAGPDRDRCEVDRTCSALF